MRIGLHPWMPAPPDTQLQFKAEHVFLPDVTALPRSPQPVNRTIDFASSRRMSDLRPLDASFAGWSGQAVVLWPEDCSGVEVSAHGAFAHSMCSLQRIDKSSASNLCLACPTLTIVPVTEFGPLHILHEAEILRGEMMIRPFLAPGGPCVR